jgi:TfoX/Sxy family transcriptional regulator of competence genes
MKKVPPENAEAFRRAIPQDPDVSIKKMFGCEAGFVNGNMFCGTFESTMIVRLDETGRKAKGFTPFVPMGRPMKEYVCVPEGKERDIGFLNNVFKLGLAYARTLPAKAAKKKPG